MLLNTLSGMASSFGELGRIMPRAGQLGAQRVRRERSLILGSEGEVGAPPVKVQKMRSLEPVMRELQGAAGRVGSEDVEFESLEY
jgi:hypothetical protein